MNGYPGMTWKLLSAILLLGGALFLATHGHSKYGRSAMAGDDNGAGLRAERPRIDTMQPSRVETATFALG